MKRFWKALFDPYMGIIITVIFINIGAQLLDIFTDKTFNYLSLNGLVTVGYIAGVAITFFMGSARE